MLFTGAGLEGVGVGLSLWYELAWRVTSLYRHTVTFTYFPNALCEPCPHVDRHAYIHSRRPGAFFFFFFLFFGGSRFPPLGSARLGPGGPGGPCGLGGLGLRLADAGGKPYVPPRLRLRSMLSASLDPDSTLWFMFPASRSPAVSTVPHITAC